MKMTEILFYLHSSVLGSFVDFLELLVDSV